jgi:hypothetical protein
MPSLIGRVGSILDSLKTKSVRAPKASTLNAKALARPWRGDCSAVTQRTPWVHFVADPPCRARFRASAASAAA